MKRSSDVNIQRILLTFLVALSILLAASCTYPKSSVKATEENSALVFKGAPETARVRIDGIEAGWRMTIPERDRWAFCPADTSWK